MAGVGLVILAGIVVHTAFNLSSSWVLKQAVRRAQNAGIRLKMEEVIPPEIPDERNAAVVYARIFELYDKLYEEHKELFQDIRDYFLSSSSFLEKMTSEQKALARKLLLKHPEFINLFSMVEKATGMPECRFPLNYEDGPGTLVPHLSKFRGLAQLFALRTCLIAQQGDYDAALQSFETSLAMGDALKSEPFVISQLVRFSVDRIAISALEAIFSEGKEKINFKDYNELISYIDKKEKTLINSWASEIAFMGGYAYGDIFHGRYRRRENFIPFINDVSGSVGIRMFWKAYPGYFFLPIFKRDAAFYLDCKTKVMQLFDKPFHIVQKQLREFDEEIERQRKYIVGGYIHGPISNIHQRQSEYMARMNTLKIVCALQIYKERTGRYPETLEQLVPDIQKELPPDPFTGKDYKYRQEDGGFVVYSAGPNQKDDDGIFDTKQGCDDISFRVSD